MDLVEEEDRPRPPRSDPLGRPLQDRPHVGHRGGHGRELFELRARRLRDDARECRLPAPGRAVEDRRAEPVLVDGERERRAGADDLFLPDEGGEPGRPKPRGQGGHVVESPARRVREEIAHAGKYAHAMATVSVRDEATELLQELLGPNTVNPPGNETIAAELLQAYLEDAGVECELYARVPERANIVARIPGRGGPTLALISHTDTVRADPEEWTVDPWSGELLDGQIWGRGALDMKSHVAAAAVAMATLAREGFVPEGDVVFVASADEEVGEDFGLSWLCANHPDAIRADYCVNEGGGARLTIGGRPAYLCGTAEKMSSPFLLRVHGRSGHASMP